LKNKKISAKKSFNKNLNHILSAVREELDDHRESINENTTEIQTSHEFLAQLDDKLDKLAVRIDELTLLVKGRSEKSSTSVKTLTKREKQVFQTIYELGNMSQFITYRGHSKAPWHVRILDCSVCDQYRRKRSSCGKALL